MEPNKHTSAPDIQGTDLTTLPEFEELADIDAVDPLAPYGGAVSAAAFGALAVLGLIPLTDAARAAPPPTAITQAIDTTEAELELIKTTHTTLRLTNYSEAEQKGFRCENSKRRGIGNDSTHCRTGTAHDPISASMAFTIFTYLWLDRFSGPTAGARDERRIVPSRRLQIIDMQSL